jgi:hypothetical protein
LDPIHHTNISVGSHQGNYPECLGKLFIVNAPWIFSTAWGFIKGFLDVRVQVIELTTMTGAMLNIRSYAQQLTTMHNAHFYAQHPLSCTAHSIRSPAYACLTAHSLTRVYSLTRSPAHSCPLAQNKINILSSSTQTQVLLDEIGAECTPRDLGGEYASDKPTSDETGFITPMQEEFDALVASGNFSW